jgi:hypothetical protein
VTVTETLPSVLNYTRKKGAFAHLLVWHSAKKALVGPFDGLCANSRKLALGKGSEREIGSNVFLNDFGG